jgi:hypothetical protein
MLPFVCFVLQYLVADRAGMEVMSSHMNQYVLILKHFEYAMPIQLVPLLPFSFDSSTLAGRVNLLLDMHIPSVYLPLLCGFLLLGNQGLEKVPGWTGEQRKRMPITLLFLLSVGAVIVFGRAPAAMLCEYNAKTTISAGDMGTGLAWLNAAAALNPSFNETSYFHVYLGRVYYTLDPLIISNDTRSYLADSYSSIRDYLDAEQELMALWHAQPNEQWVINQTSNTLEWLAEFKQLGAVSPVPQLRTVNDIDSATWLQQLSEVDSTNAYAQYALGRLNCYLHGYNTCISNMIKVIQLSSDKDIQSNAYGYIGIAYSEQGSIVQARQILDEALKLDPLYLNNTAREEVSGLH